MAVLKENACTVVVDQAGKFRFRFHLYSLVSAHLTASHLHCLLLGYLVQEPRKVYGSLAQSKCSKIVSKEENKPREAEDLLKGIGQEAGVRGNWGLNPRTTLQ